MLKLIDITWLYHHLPMRFTLSVAHGEQIAILGPSGAGKSTLLNLIAGFLTPASGNMVIDGEDHTTTPPSRRPVSMLFQENNLFSHLSVQQNIGLGLNPGLKLNASQREKILHIAQQMGIDSLLERLPGELSGGQRQRVAVARALAMEPKIILADEPVSALDKSVQAQVLNLFHDLQKEFGISIIFISHDLSVVEYMSDHIAVLYLGEVIEYSTSEELYHNPRHPYTKELLRSIPQISGDARLSTANREPPIELPSPIRPPSGCRYHPRCPYRTENCSKHIPAPALVGRDHIVKCHRCAAQNQPIEPMEGSLI